MRRTRITEGQSVSIDDRMSLESRCTQSGAVSENKTGKVRAVRLRTSGASMQRLPGGVVRVWAEEPLGPYPNVLTDRLAQWASSEPNETCLAKRARNGEWNRLRYADVLASVRRIGQALLQRKLYADRAVRMLAEYDFEHPMIMLGGQNVGIPTAHVWTVHSLVSSDFARLKHVVNLLTPGLIFGSEFERYRRAIEAVAADDIE